MSGARAQAPCSGEGTEAAGPKAVVPHATDHLRTHEGIVRGEHARSLPQL